VLKHHTGRLQSKVKDSDDDNDNDALNFWVVPRRVVFNSRRFGTLCLFHLHRRVNMKRDTSRRFGTLCLFHLHRRMNMKRDTSRRFGTLCLFHLHRRVDMKLEQTVFRNVGY
jgi:hypothetical protein